MANKKDKKPEKAKSKKLNPGKLSLNFIFGDLISSSLFSRNKFTILITITLMLLYISIKYKCKTRMETINNLQAKLEIVKSESIHEQSVYMSNTRESTMQARIDSMHLNLHVQQQPPYKLKYHAE